MKKIVFAPPQTGPPAHPSSASLVSVSLSPRKYFPTWKYWKYFPAPLHDQSRLKKIPKGSFPPKDVCPRFGTSCCRGVADAPARSSERASHAQNSLRLFHRVRVHVHLSRALSRAPSASLTSSSGSFPRDSPSPNLHPRARASLVAPFLSRAFTRGE